MVRCNQALAQDTLVNPSALGIMYYVYILGK